VEELALVGMVLLLVWIIAAVAVMVLITVVRKVLERSERAAAPRGLRLDRHWSQ
jgi:hypothetical protein